MTENPMVAETQRRVTQERLTRWRSLYSPTQETAVPKSKFYHETTSASEGATNLGRPGQRMEALHSPSSQLPEGSSTSSVYLWDPSPWLLRNSSGSLCSSSSLEGS